MNAQRNDNPYSDALTIMRQTRSDMRSICRSAATYPDSLRGFLAPYARGHYRRARATAMRPVRLP